LIARFSNPPSNKPIQGDGEQQKQKEHSARFEIKKDTYSEQKYISPRMFFVDKTIYGKHNRKKDPENGTCENEWIRRIKTKKSFNPIVPG
jgi:hypothetical protein